MSDHDRAEFVEPGEAHGEVHPLHRPRVALVSRIDAALRGLPIERDGGGDYYAAYRLAVDEHAANVHGSFRHSRRLLDDMGFVYEPVAAVKTHPNRDIYSWGSYTLRADAAPHAPDYVGEDEQLHVHLFPTPDRQTIEWHAHLELCWRTRPRDHYNAELYDLETARRLVSDLLELETNLQRGDDYSVVV